MKSFSLSFLLLLCLASCTEAPECHFAGNTHNDNEANAGCLVVHNNKALMIEGQNGSLSLPGGGWHSGESPQCTAERETWEETGIEVKATERIVTFANGFQLFDCEIAGEQAVNGAARPWRFEVANMHWFGEAELSEAKNWRFPDQIALIKAHLKENLKSD